MATLLRRSGGDRHRRRRPGRWQLAKLELVDPDRAAPAAASSDGELESGQVTDLATAERPPGEADMTLLDGERLPLGRELHVPPHAPPDIVAARIDELELQVVRRRRTTQAEGEGIVLGQIEVELPARDGVTAAAVEIEVETETAPALTDVGAEGEIDAIGRVGRPDPVILESIQEDRCGARSSDRVLRCFDVGAGQSQGWSP